MLGAADPGQLRGPRGAGLGAQPPPRPFVLHQNISAGFAGWEGVGKQSGRKSGLVYVIYRPA